MKVDDSELDVPASKEKTAALRELVLEAYVQDSAIAGLEMQIENRKNRLSQLMNKDIPELMSEIGTNVFGVPDTRTEVRVMPYYHANIPAATAAEAYKWLEDQGHGDIIKNALHVDFNKEDAAVAKQVYDRVNQMMAEYDVPAKPVLEKGVHWKTLTSFVKERIESGETLPLAILGATVGQVAKFKERKNG